MKKRLTMFLACLLLSVGAALAQTQVTGKVTSAEDGEPIIGASVKVVGSATGVMTDAEGHFSLNVPSNAQLEISYIGMQTQTVRAARNLNIVLNSDVTQLQELVVTGYGSAKKLGTIAGSVETVNGKTLENRPIANIGDALQGQVSGLQVFTSSGEPSQTTSMRVRGVTSINASTEPLFILDGSEISNNTFVSLNPNDIESMTVLKDASATAIYGSRAANGVIVLTSKRAAFGEAPTVTVSAQYGISKMVKDRADMMDANEWLDFQEIINPAMANNASFQAQKAYYRKYNIGTNWVKEMMGGSAPTSQFDVSVRGGTHNLSYLLSYGHFDTDGIEDDSNMRRETIRANIEANINPWLKVGLNSNLAYTKYRESLWGVESGGSANSWYNKATFAHWAIPIQTKYEVLGLNPADYANSTFDGYGEALRYYDMIGVYDPYYISSWQPRHNTRVRLNENAFVNINPIKGLNWRTAVGLEGNDLRGSYQWTITLPEEPNVNPTGSARETFSRVYRWTVTNTLEYKFKFLRDHDVTLLAGQESMYSKSTGFNATAHGMTDPRLMLMSAGSEADLPSHTLTEEVRNSWFGMLNYSYADKYFVDLSIRRDGSSLFGKNNRWATFGAIGAMWNITKENFMKGTSSWLNDLALKVSYGTTGNSGINPYMALGLVSSGPLYNGQGGTAISNPSNPDLTWETVKTFNLALTGKVLDRVTFDLEYYNKITSDMLMSMPYSYTTGFSSGWGNIAKMVNRGFDFTIGVDIIKNKDWYWNVKVNGNYNRNKIRKLFNGIDSYHGDQDLEVGHSYGEFYFVRWSHVDPRDGMNVWLDKNGNETKTYSDDDAVWIGKNMFAPWSGGLLSTLSWKGFQLDLQFSGMFHRYMYNNDKYFIENPQFASSNNQSRRMFNIWQKPGDITNIAGVDAEYHHDTHNIESATFVRLKFLQLSYSLPQSLLQRTHFIKGAKVYFVGRNLLTITPYNGYDPEVDSNVTLGNYPNTRQYSIGMQLTF